MENHFIHHIIQEDLKTGKHESCVKTRFPPEPNGYLHIGHAKSIYLNFGIAQKYNGKCHLRFDDTNPVKEKTRYVQSIKEDVHWLGYTWDQLLYASDHFEKFYHYAIQLIHLEKAYVCDLKPEEIREYRGTLTEPGRDSPFRNRLKQENLDLFERMKKGEFKDGSRVLRAKIDMRAPNLNLRDPVLYRIMHASHHRTHNQWCIYPLYDYAHPLSDMLEGITHSLCTLEFEDHRSFYDWLLNTLNTPCHPDQIEFSRLNLNYTVMSKRKLFQLVQEKKVDGWDDPRMPTIQGLRRRGYTPESIRDFCERVGVTKKESFIEINLLELCIREHLEKTAQRLMGVLNPLKVVIENYPENQNEEMEIANHPQNPTFGSRKVFFSKVIYIEKEDFQENPSKNFFRLSPGKEVRLRSAYFIKCTGFKKDEKSGEITELQCTYDPETKGGKTPNDKRKVQATLHWVSEKHAISAEIRLYDFLFMQEFPGKEHSNFLDQINPHSLTILKNAKVEPLLLHMSPETRFQFERQGYYCIDRKDSSPHHLVLNRIVSLRENPSLKKRG